VPHFSRVLCARSGRIIPDVFPVAGLLTWYVRIFYIGHLMSTRVISPASGISGSIHLPGDKSISHRYAMLGAVAEGTTTIDNFSTGADCASTVRCMQSLGVVCDRDNNRVVIHGRGPKLHPPSAPLDCGNSGSTIRMLSGILAGQDFSCELTGDESLSRRPMARVITPLEQMGARIASRDGGRPPLRITGRKLNAIDYTMPVASAQVKSALLFAGLFADGETRITESVRTRDHSELALRAFGAQVEQKGSAVCIRGGQKLKAIEATVPGDLSITNLGMNPTRSYLLDLLAGMGLRISVTQLEEAHGELTGVVQATGGELRGTSIQGPQTAMLIDEIPVLAAIAPFTSTGIEIRDARELRVKESDRIKAIATCLRALGAEVEEHDDGLKIPGNQKLRGAEIDSFGDHRIAMAFAVAALRAAGPTTIRNADAAVISYPEFFDVLASIAQR